MNHCRILRNAALCIFGSIATNAAAYSIHLTGQALGLSDGNMVSINELQNDGATSLAFDTQTVTATDGQGTARAAAAADLATGQLKIYAEAGGNQVASAYAQIHELVTFDLPTGMSSSQVTVNFRITGNVSGLLNGGALPLSLSFIPVAGGVGGTESISLHDFTSPHLLSITTQVQNGAQYQLVASLMGSLDGPGVIDLNNTGRLSFNLEHGVSFSSESGTFLSAVPIPGALWLFGSGLLGLAGLRHRATAPG